MSIRGECELHTRNGGIQRSLGDDRQPFPLPIYPDDLLIPRLARTNDQCSIAGRREGAKAGVGKGGQSNSLRQRNGIAGGLQMVRIERQRHERAGLAE